MPKLYVHDFTLLQGSTLDKSFTLTANATPVDLTTYSARMQARATVDDVTTLLSLTSGAGELILGASTGNVRILVGAVATAALTFTTAVYDLELVSADATPVVRRLMRGTITLSKEVTR